jgi:transcriptional regulator with XRE-family HTH domain
MSKSIPDRETREEDVVVGGNIRALRKAAGLSQTELGEAAGVKFQQVQKYETGFNRVSASRLIDFSRALDVSPMRFFDGIELPDESSNTVTARTRDEAMLLERLRRVSELQRDAVLGLLLAMSDFET